MRARVPRLVLFVAIFLATQAPAYLHAAAHPAGGLDLGCEICLKVSGSGGVALPADAGAPAPPVVATWNAPPSVPHCLSAEITHPPARGPPLLA